MASSTAPCSSERAAAFHACDQISVAADTASIEVLDYVCMCGQPSVIAIITPLGTVLARLGHKQVSRVKRRLLQRYVREINLGCQNSLLEQTMHACMHRLLVLTSILNELINMSGICAWQMGTPFHSIIHIQCPYGVIPVPPKATRGFGFCAMQLPT